MDKESDALRDTVHAGLSRICTQNNGSYGFKLSVNSTLSHCGKFHRRRLTIDFLHLFLDLPVMSIYDIAVEKLGFPAIELFVKVSGAIRRKVTQTKLSFHSSTNCIFSDKIRKKKSSGMKTCVATTPLSCQVHK